MKSGQETDFDRFITYAGERQGPQVLCAVVCAAAMLEEGEGISLSPVTCIDLPLHKIKGYQDVINAGGLLGHDWEVMCITMLDGQDGNIANAIDTNKRLDLMLGLIKQGRADRMLMFDRSEQHIRLADYNYSFGN
ncbi:MAG: hypothetical protein GYB33_22495 [Gammaproteobacteria bacterium]|nr:hypothetical protein [Gammaproteobacteria bacterium]